MPDQRPTLSTAEARAYVGLDNRGQPSVSPTERREFETSRIAYVASLERLVDELRAALRRTEIERDNAVLKLRGRG